MPDSHFTYGPALKAAVRAVRRNPDLPGMARKACFTESKPSALRTFAADRSVRAYLRTAKSGKAVTGVALVDLLDAADWWLDGGERWAVAALYERRQVSGEGALGARERNLYRAVCMLAYRDGARVVASTRYLGVLLATEFGDAAAHPTSVDRSLKRLQAANLIEVNSAPGYAKSNIVSVAADLERVETEPSMEALAAVTMHPLTALALLEYSASARAGRVAKKGNVRLSWPAPALKPAPAGGDGVSTLDVVPGAVSSSRVEALLQRIDLDGMDLDVMDLDVMNPAQPVQRSRL